MERHPPHWDDNERYPAANSYGSDDPETQAYIENARVDAARERRRNREALERLVALGLSPDDAETIIETELAMTQMLSDDELRGERLDNARDDLAKLVDLKDQPHGAAALAALARDLRRGAVGLGTMPAAPEAVASYQAIGLDRRDALTVAGFEYYLRYRLAIADDPWATHGIEAGDTAVELQPRVYIEAQPEDGQDPPHGRWIDVAQSADDIEEEISELLHLFPATGSTRWSVTAARDFGELDLAGVNDSEMLATLGQGVVDHGPAFLAWAEHHGTHDRELLSRFTDFYVGSYRNEQDWGESIAVDLGWLDQLDRSVDSPLRDFLSVDYDKIARHTLENWDVVTGVDGQLYVFMR